MFYLFIDISSGSGNSFTENAQKTGTFIFDVKYTLCSKKLDHQTHGGNFVKS